MNSHGSKLRSGHQIHSSPERTAKLSAYNAPQTGLLSLLPEQCIPYAELIRLDKPAGGIYLYFPSLFGSLLASSCASTPPSPSKLAWVNLWLYLAAMIYRSLACTWNDILDRDIDRKVTRTRLRPMARGAISVEKAVAFTLVQVACGSVLAYRLNAICFYYTLPFLVILGFYPYGKRITFYPAMILGLGWAWGAVIGFPAVGVDPFSSTTTTQAMSYLYASNIVWCILYDTIYSHQDLEDDKLSGVKSIPIKFEGQTKRLLATLAVLQIALLIPCGRLIDASRWYYVGTCIGGGLTLALMIVTVDLKQPKSCMWWFKWGSLITGLVISTGFLYEYSQHP
ncbi:MAG: hypothetical protein Q9182_000936 [Xanthomendoza sp. 2 TL-2023]